MRRFICARLPSDESGWIVLDAKDPEHPIVRCECRGWKGSVNATYIADALEAYHRDLIDTVMGTQSFV